MNKAELIKAVAGRTGESHAATGRTLDGLVTEIRQAAARGESVDFSGLAHFNVEHKAARVGRNPKTGAEIQIPAKNAVTIKPAKALKDAANP